MKMLRGIEVEIVLEEKKCQAPVIEGHEFESPRIRRRELFSKTFLTLFFEVISTLNFHTVMLNLLFLKYFI